MKQFFTFVLSLCSLCWVAPAEAATPTPPNIILIYADDIGYGDLQCYGGRRIHTPHVDQLARQGMRFTDGYAMAATCSPSRFSILTGNYAFRQKGTGILPGDAALIIRPGSATLPAILQRAGYATAAIGKWHLGLGARAGAQDWNGDLRPGPLEVGFGYCFIIPATPDRVPCVFVRNHRVVNLEPSDPIRVSYAHPLPGEVCYGSNPNLPAMASSHGHTNALINGIGRIGYMTGGTKALWKDDEIEPTLVREAVQFMEREKNHPFFLYYASHDNHVPRVPNHRFVGQTGMGPRGDEIAEFDWAVGELLKTVNHLGLSERTLIVLTSDNGPVLDDGYKDQANELVGDHKPAGPLRAGKYSIFEGGTRVPFIVCWPGHVKSGVSDALISQVDLLASFAALTGQPVPREQVLDSQNLLSVLLGQSSVGRQNLVTWDQDQELSIRSGDWKYILPGQTLDGLGPWTKVIIPKEGFLFNLSNDLGEINNLAPQNPGRVAAMSSLLSGFMSKSFNRLDPNQN